MGAYVKMADWQDKSPSERDYLRIAAHNTACGGHSVYSHATAARIWGLNVWNGGPLVHVRLTSLEQTIVDCTRTTSFVTAVILGDSGLHRGVRVAWRVLAAGSSYRLDAAWRDIKLALEFDGKTKYFDYKRTDQAIFEERQRERELMEVGWTFLRVEWKDLENPELLERRILAAMATAR